jgi:hypothetical protein
MWAETARRSTIEPPCSKTVTKTWLPLQGPITGRLLSVSNMPHHQPSCSHGCCIVTRVKFPLPSLSCARNPAGVILILPWGLRPQCGPPTWPVYDPVLGVIFAVLLALTLGFLAGLVIWGGLLLSYVGGVDSFSTLSAAFEEMTKPVVHCKDLNSRENLTDAEKILKSASCDPTPAPAQ